MLKTRGKSHWQRKEREWCRASLENRFGLPSPGGLPEAARPVRAAPRARRVRPPSFAARARKSSSRRTGKSSASLLCSPTISVRAPRWRPAGPAARLARSWRALALRRGSKVDLNLTLLCRVTSLDSCHKDFKWSIRKLALRPRRPQAGERLLAGASCGSWLWLSLLGGGEALGSLKVRALPEQLFEATGGHSGEAARRLGRQRPRARGPRRAEPSGCWQPAFASLKLCRSRTTPRLLSAWRLAGTRGRSPLGGCPLGGQLARAPAAWAGPGLPASLAAQRVAWLANRLVLVSALQASDS